MRRELLMNNLLNIEDSHSVRAESCWDGGFVYFSLVQDNIFNLLLILPLPWDSEVEVLGIISLKQIKILQKIKHRFWRCIWRYLIILISAQINWLIYEQHWTWRFTGGYFNKYFNFYISSLKASITFLQDFSACVENVPNWSNFNSKR